MSLKEQTQDLHDVAEKTKFAQLLMSGNITKHQYASYLYNLYPIYEAIESSADLSGIEDIARADKIKADLEELNQPELYLTQYVNDYAEYIKRLSKDKIMAHLYIRHFGDLYGGQMIKSRIPGSGTMYEFENRKELIGKTRMLLSDELGPEARVAFEWALQLFEDLENELNL